MFLKTLYISGFKSFAYPTKIDFTRDVSAIVGPNGSGKSNISDAIRFVLGEQRTKIMRSHSMQDIIFSGTDSENPRGVAQVRLVMDREDQPDLIIERKYYRTGESDYLLNGRKVRLKDIQAEFWDTGLGKNGYSIISQGGVENIVGSTPTQLRELVEEAVGISGFKNQQVETNRRLDQIQVNIERVSDILEEQKKQLKPLKKQAKKTREYLEISNTIRDIDLVSFYEKQLKFNKELEMLGRQLTDVNFSIIDLDKTSEQHDRRYLKLKENSNTLQNDIDHFLSEKEQLNQKQNELIQKETEIEKQLNSSQIKAGQLKLRIMERSESLDNDQKHLGKHESKLKQLNADFQEQEEITRKNERDLYRLKVKLEELNSESVQEQYHKIEEELSKATLKRYELNAEFQQKKTANEENTQKLHSLEIEISQLEEQNNNYLSDKNYLDREYSESLKELDTCNEKIKRLNTDRNKLSNNLSVLNEKLAYQIKLKESYSGFNESVRSVMNYAKSNNLTDVFGTVRDLFSVPSEFQTAIQIALGYSAQNVVVKNSKTAQELINYLKRNDKGRATFLPLDSMNFQPVQQKEKILKQKGVIGFANDLIETDPKFTKVFGRLLGRTLIIDTYNNAESFRRSNRQFTLVTLEGECFYNSGAIVGGSIKKGTSQIFTPQNEINKLESDKTVFKKNLEKLNNTLNKIETFSQRIKEKVNSNKNKLDSTNSILVNLNNRLGLYNQQKENITQSIESLSNYKEALSKQDSVITSLKAKLSETDRINNRHTRNVEEIREEIFKLQETVSQNKIKENKINQQIILLKERIEELETRITDSKVKQENDQKQLNELNSSSHFELEKLQELKTQKEKVKEKINQFNTTISEGNLKIKKLSEKQSKLENQIKEINKARIDEAEAKNKIERRQDQIENEQKNLQTSIFEKYSMTFSMVKDQIEQLKSAKKDYSKAEVNELKKRITAMGPINPNAIEEYHNLKLRYEELRANYCDLEDSKEDVLDTIDRLNETMRKQFKEQFEELNRLFSKIFTTLFEGGKAKLSYNKEVDILETGVELFAQPPGKHLKNINLLSGGEKAMTAIALLFSFIQLNPTPFVIIDEIDAALDESNIARFTRYIEKIKEDNQFIVITHRKGTVQMCDNIHGISMADDGISRCCSFEISDYLD